MASGFDDLTFISMLTITQRLVLCVLLFYFSCVSADKRGTVIADYRPVLQPHLKRVVTDGIVTYQTDELEALITDRDLVQLSKSEHPILRAYALRLMINKETFDGSELLLQHLNDTARVLVDNGEFGTSFKMIADELITIKRWNTLEAKTKTVNAVITQHNYLRSAYTILKYIPAQELYYPYIRNMAERPRKLDSEGYELGFDDIEYALYGLAKFKKSADVPLIKSRLLTNVNWLSDRSFTLMKEYPDTAYMEVLREYHRYKFYKFSGNRPGGFTGIAADRAAPEDFIYALVAQQSNESARLIDTMMLYLPKMNRMPERENILFELKKAIWNKPCAAYAGLRKKIQPEMIQSNTTDYSIKFENAPVNEKAVFWWYE